MIVKIGRLMISAAEYPNIRSAAGLQRVTTPSGVVLTIASPDDSTIAASSVGEALANFRTHWLTSLIRRV